MNSWQCTASYQIHFFLRGPTGRQTMHIGSLVPKTEWDRPRMHEHDTSSCPRARL
jgi:hypothetical protein